MVDEVNADIYGDGTPFSEFSDWYSAYLEENEGTKAKLTAIEVASFFVSVAMLKDQSPFVIVRILSEAVSKANGAVAELAEEDSEE